VAVLALGIYAFNFGQVLSNIAAVPPVAIGLMVAGIVVVLISFMGCFGAGRESKPLLGVYLGLLLIIIASVIAVGVLAYGFTGELDTVLQQGWKSAPDSSKQWIYQNFDCCGYIVPDNSTVCQNAFNSNNSTVTPCKEKLLDFYLGKMKVIEIAGICFGAVLILGLVFTICLCCSVVPAEEERFGHYAEVVSIN